MCRKKLRSHHLAALAAPKPAEASPTTPTRNEPLPFVLSPVAPTSPSTPTNYGLAADNGVQNAPGSTSNPAASANFSALALRAGDDPMDIDSFPANPPAPAPLDEDTMDIDTVARGGFRGTTWYHFGVASIRRGVMQV